MVKKQDDIRLINEIQDCLRGREALEQMRNVKLIDAEYYDEKITALNDKSHALIDAWIAEEYEG